ncbi:nitronate monooxygenase [Mucilaginibacter robiniae]|uniref:Nitronate monooxygenase n=1 Tax=Mucilaginibacter robiniae TaxID=2728022 RepID=A0A7L5DVU9_9SPHI|nr:nitronate monooxygenase [Mucilaginibacter robiniae]QJD95225.1 nitronate monooxygenase [Mucilaginibacter robiniae]
MENLKRLLNISYPIVQAPMLGVTTPAMVAAVANTGALGSLPVGGLSPERTLELIKTTKSLTRHSFAVNLFAHPPAETVNKEELDLMQNFLAELCQEYSIPFERKDVDSFQFYYYEDLFQVLLDEDIKVVSFTFGQLNSDTITAFKNKGTILIGTATSVAEAQQLMQDGIDIITVQGLEAGGHRGTFLINEPVPQVGLLSLLPQVADQVSLPLLAAGGIYDARTIKAAFTLGASGVQVGSLFITADESAASETYKKAVLQSQETSTILTQAFSGRWARGIHNEFMRRMEAKGLSIPYYTFQNQLIGPIRTYAQQHQLKDMIAMWAGQSAGRASRGTTEQIITRLINELSAEYKSA